MDLILESRKPHHFIRCYEDVLIKSGIFNVTRQEQPENTMLIEEVKRLFGNKYRAKYGGLCFIKIGGRLVILEAFMRPVHNHKLFLNGMFNNIKPDFWVSFYHDPEFEDMIKCPVRPWITFPCGFDFVNKFQWHGPKKYTGFITSGKASALLMRRVEWIKHAQGLGDFFATGHPIAPEKYLQTMLESTWGIILSHKRLKNTREYEYPSCGMPMALNYMPIFEYPFNPNEHYILLEDPEDLTKLRDINPHHYARQSRWIWDNYLRPDRAAALLLRMLP